MVVGEIASRVPMMEAGTVAPTTVLMTATAESLMPVSGASMALMAVSATVTTMSLGRVATSVVPESTAERLASVATSLMARTVTAMTSAVSAPRERLARGPMMRAAKTGVMAAMTVLAATKAAMTTSAKVLAVTVAAVPLGVTAMTSAVSAPRERMA